MSVSDQLSWTITAGLLIALLIVCATTLALFIHMNAEGRRYERINRRLTTKHNRELDELRAQRPATHVMPRSVDPSPAAAEAGLTDVEYQQIKDFVEANPLTLPPELSIVRNPRDAA